MSGTLDISDFSHSYAKFIDVHGTQYTLPVRSVYLNASPSPTDLLPATGADANKPLFPHPRRAPHVYITGQEGDGTEHRRRVPTSCVFPSTSTATQSMAATVIDGITGWEYGGWTGQRDRSKP